MLSATGEEFPDFIVPASLIFGLAPDDARAQLERRSEKLSAELVDAEAELRDYPGLPRLFLLEEEYRRTVLRAELAWLAGVIAELRAGRLSWSEKQLRDLFVAFHPPLYDQEEV